MARSSEKRQMPRTEEVALMAAEAGSVESLAGTILLDRYRLIKMLGSGGAAAVYKAEHSIMHKPLAVKVLRPECAVREEFVRRFIGEARMVAKLRHEHIVDVIDIGRTESGIVFCVMEYLEGETLADTLLRDGPMPLPRAQAIMMQVCSALAAAHAVNVVHRDVKPENCFRVRQAGNPDFVKLLDFGIAKQLDAATGLTNTGVIMGTAEYMSPEQARGSAGVDARADIYSVGAMLFELLTGLPPFMGESFLDVLLRHSTEPIPKICQLVPDLPPAMDLVIERALAKKPADRFPTMDDFTAALSAVGEATVLAPSPIPMEVAAEPSYPPASVPEAPTAATMPSPRLLTGPQPARRSTGTRGGLVAAVVFGAALVLGISAAVYFASDPGEDVPSSALPEHSPASASDAQNFEAKPHEGEVADAKPDTAVHEPGADHKAKANSPDVDGVDEREEEAGVDEDGEKSANAAPSSDAAPELHAKTPKTKKAPSAGKPSAKAISKQLASSIRRACKAQVFEDKKIVVRMPNSGTPSVTVAPPYRLLQQCVERNLQGVPLGTYKFTVRP